MLHSRYRIGFIASAKDQLSHMNSGEEMAREFLNTLYFKIR